MVIDTSKLMKNLTAKHDKDRRMLLDERAASGITRHRNTEIQQQLVNLGVMEKMTREHIAYLEKIASYFDAELKEIIT